MSLTRHLLATDLRRSRVILAAFVATVIAVTALEMVRLTITANSRLLVGFTLAGTLLWLAKTLLLLTMVPLIVQAYPLVGSDGFWMTRPIAPRTLLASRLVLLVALVVFLPVACELVFMTVYKIPPADMALVALQSTMLQMLLLIALMCAATVTRNIAGFALLGGATLVALALSIVAMVLSLSHDEGYALVAVGLQPVPLDIGDPTSDVIFAVLAAIAGLALIAVQYRTRSRKHSVPIGGAAFALAWVLPGFWPWPILQPRISVPAWASSSETLRLSADAGSVSFVGQNGWMDQTKWRNARARVRLDGLPPGWRADIRLARASVDLGGGRLVVSHALRYSESPSLESAPDDIQQRPVMRQVLDVDRLSGFGEGRASEVSVFVARIADVQADAGKTGAYSGTYHIDLTREEIAATLPIQPGARFQEGSQRFVIDGVERSPGAGVSLRLRRSGAGSIFSRRRPSTYSYYLRNPAVREATMTISRPLLEPLMMPLFQGHVTAGADPGAGFYVNEELVSRQAYSLGPADETFMIDDRWLAGAELVIVRTTRQGSVARTLTIPAFTLFNPQ